jgi:hypothetical protein
MSNKDFTATISVDQSPEEAFNAINKVRGWWSENIESGTDKLGAEFTYRYQDVHFCRVKIAELILAKKVVWHVLEIVSISLKTRTSGRARTSFLRS